MSKSDECRAWTMAWSDSMPDEIVAEQVEDEEGAVDPDCLPDDRLEKLVDDDLLPMEFHPDPPEDEEEESAEESSTKTVQTEVSEQ